MDWHCYLAVMSSLTIHPPMPFLFYFIISYGNMFLKSTVENRNKYVDPKQSAVLFSAHSLQDGAVCLKPFGSKGILSWILHIKEWEILNKSSHQLLCEAQNSEYLSSFLKAQILLASKLTSIVSIMSERFSDIDHIQKKKCLKNDYFIS